jgi:EAL domain-containing protein (putative c-di-GMP-specific phosphodiesterase class I)
MKALGIGLSLTGFGAGYVSPVQLQDLPVDLLKIDGVFIQPLKRSTDDRLFVRTLIDRAHHLGVATMAEWVDDEDMARMLASWGVDYLEGSLFGEFRPAVQPRTLREMAKAIRAGEAYLLASLSSLACMSAIWRFRVSRSLPASS